MYHQGNGLAVVSVIGVDVVVVFVDVVGVADVEVGDVDDVDVGVTVVDGILEVEVVITSAPPSPTKNACKPAWVPPGKVLGTEFIAEEVIKEYIWSSMVARAIDSVGVLSPIL